MKASGEGARRPLVRQVHQLGDTFAGYEIEELLGRGGMSEVVRARNPKLGNVVALKLLAPELAEDDVFRERFVRESRIAASLDHPNALPIHDAGEADGVPYIAMRFVDGPNLGQLLRRSELPVEHAVSIVAQVAGALDAAHERGLIHRDVKPANILIDRYFGADAAPHVYLADFGVAKHTLSRSGLTSTGEFVGTIDYVAPEQIEGKPVDSRTDVYSLGCVLYECLTGKKPFDRDSNVAVMYAHLLEPPPVPSEARTGLPPELDAVVAKALAKSPDERYATCGELAAAARAALAGAPATAANDAAPPPEPDEATSAPSPVAYLEIDSGTGIVARSLPPPPAPEPVVATDTDATRRLRPAVGVPRRNVLAGVLVLLVLAGVAVGAAKLLGNSKAASPPPQRTNSTSQTTTTTSTSTTKKHQTKHKPVLATVPKVRGATRWRAARLLKAQGLRPTIRREYSSTVPAGHVIKQSRAAGRHLKKNTHVVLIVSRGRKPAPKTTYTQPQTSTPTYTQPQTSTTPAPPPTTTIIHG